MTGVKVQCLGMSLVRNVKTRIFVSGVWKEMLEAAL